MPASQLNHFLPQLSQALREADAVLAAYGKGSWLRRLLEAKLASRELARVHKLIQDAMQQVCGCKGAMGEWEL